MKKQPKSPDTNRQPKRRNRRVITSGAGNRSARRAHSTFGIFAEIHCFIGGTAKTGCHPGT